MPFPVLDACLYLYAGEKLSPPEVALALRTVFPEIAAERLAGWAERFARAVHPLDLQVGAVAARPPRRLARPRPRARAAAPGRAAQRVAGGLRTARRLSPGPPRGGSAAYAAVVLGCLALAPWIARAGWVGNVYIHTLHETVAVLLALGVAAIALVRFHSRKSDTFLLLGTAFAGTAFLDGYHALATSAFFAERFQASDLASTSPWSWLASRLFLAVFLWMNAPSGRRASDAARLDERDGLPAGRARSRSPASPSSPSPPCRRPTFRTSSSAGRPSSFRRSSSCSPCGAICAGGAGASGGSSTG